METRDNLKYTENHEWIRVDGDIATVGITDFAQKELGDVVYVDVHTLDDTLNKDDVFGTLEAVKTVSDVFLPVSGEILEFNESLDDHPEFINESPYDKGWIIKIKIKDSSQLNKLLDAKSYAEISG